MILMSFRFLGEPGCAFDGIAQASIMANANNFLLIVGLGGLTLKLGISLLPLDRVNILFFFVSFSKPLDATGIAGRNVQKFHRSNTAVKNPAGDFCHSFHSPASN